jgi:hypothetical protein
MAVNNNIKTFRFEFSKGFIQELSRFSKVHQYDERHTYKKEWNSWKSDPQIAEIMEMEKRRLEENGYNGDIDDKMFKSGRYYFRKKTAAADTGAAALAEEKYGADEEEEQAVSTPTATTATTATTTTTRKPYITMSKHCIKMMDDHIKQQSTNINFKPSSCYDHFYNEQLSSSEMVTEIGKIIEKYEKVRQSRQPLNTPAPVANAQTVEDITNEIMDKIKKTYKNRYYRFVNNNNDAAAAILGES